MGCCSTKSDSLNSLPKSTIPTNPDFCVAYIRKDHLKALFTRVSDSTTDDTALINKLMLNFNSELDLGLLLE